MNMAMVENRRSRRIDKINVPFDRAIDEVLPCDVIVRSICAQCILPAKELAVLKSAAVSRCVERERLDLLLTRGRVHERHILRREICRAHQDSCAVGG